MRKCIGCPLTAGVSPPAALPIVSNQAGNSSSLRQPEIIEMLFFLCVIFAWVNTILEEKKANYWEQSSHVWKCSIRNGSVWETNEQMLKNYCITRIFEVRVVANSSWKKSHGEEHRKRNRKRKNGGKAKVNCKAYCKGEDREEGSNKKKKAQTGGKAGWR